MKLDEPHISAGFYVIWILGATVLTLAPIFIVLGR